MKLIRLAAFSLLLCASTLQASPLNPEGNAKITKNEAEHIALKRFPGAHVTWSKLETKEGKLVWSLELAGPAQHVAVDAMTGRIAIVDSKRP
ncbi:MAG TPA: PepSY domain-containing protein [Chthoniobacterales bacterium]